MGSCISKCRPRKKMKQQDDDQDCHVVEDKLVIEIPKMPSYEKPRSPASSSSFSCSDNTKCTTTSSSSSSLSTSSSSSSSLFVKDRSFTNEFLWSCVKENPHIIGLNPSTTIDQKNTLKKPFDPSPFLASPMVSKVQETKAATPKKRARASSPTLVRQKSFRNAVHSTPNRGLRSPSPSRRFTNNAKTVATLYESPSRRHTVSKPVNGANHAAKREGFRAPTASPVCENYMAISPNYNRFDHVLERVRTKVDDGVSVGEMKKCRQDQMDVVMEDINNPLIALDCFIFL